MRGENRPHSEIYAEAGHDWCDKEGAASLLEDLKSAFLAQRMAMLPDMAVNRAEGMVKSSKEWQEYVEKTVNARKAANLAKVQMEVERMRFSESINKQANDRQELKMS